MTDRALTLINESADLVNGRSRARFPIPIIYTMSSKITSQVIKVLPTWFRHFLFSVFVQKKWIKIEMQKFVKICESVFSIKWFMERLLFFFLQQRLNKPLNHRVIIPRSIKIESLYHGKCSFTSSSELLKLWNAGLWTHDDYHSKKKKK